MQDVQCGTVALDYSVSWTLVSTDFTIIPESFMRDFVQRTVERIFGAIQLGSDVRTDVLGVGTLIA